MDKKKKHADFQDDYTRSSNFGRSEADDNLEIKKDGELKKKADAEMQKQEEKETVHEILDDLSKTSSDEEE